MLNKYSYYHKLGIEQITLSYIEKCEAQINPQFKAIDDIAEFNQLKVLHAMQENKLSDICFTTSFDNSG